MPYLNQELATAINRASIWSETDEGSYFWMRANELAEEGFVTYKDKGFKPESTKNWRKGFHRPEEAARAADMLTPSVMNKLEGGVDFWKLVRKHLIFHAEEKQPKREFQPKKSRNLLLLTRRKRGDKHAQ